MFLKICTNMLAGENVYYAQSTARRLLFENEQFVWVSCVLLGSNCLQVSVSGPTASMLSTWGLTVTLYFCTNSEDLGECNLLSITSYKSFCLLLVFKMLLSY